MHRFITVSIVMLGLWAGAAGSSRAAEPLPAITVYKSQTCGCCAKWAEYLRRNGFEVEVFDVRNVAASRERLGMPVQYASCHSAKVGRYAIEGHVPAADIKRLLREKPDAVGLTVPSMPPGSPGMESDKPVPYDTLLVSKNGTYRIYSRH